MVTSALLRGVNMGGNKRMKMADLKQSMETLGFKQVQTYIQSGNVLFTSDEGEETLRAAIERQIETVFGFSAPVVLRSAGELQAVVQHCPFAGEAAREVLSVCFFAEPPGEDIKKRILALKAEGEECVFTGRELYALFPHGFGDSRLGAGLSRLPVPLTVRNFKTVCKLNELAQSALTAN